MHRSHKNKAEFAFAQAVRDEICHFLLTVGVHHVVVFLPVEGVCYLIGAENREFAEIIIIEAAPRLEEFLRIPHLRVDVVVPDALRQRFQLLCASFGKAAPAARVLNGSSWEYISRIVS
mgnify:CR=1 FL=1